MNSFIRTTPDDYYNEIMERLVEWDKFVATQVDNIQPLKRSFLDNFLNGPAEQNLDVRLKNTENYIISYGPKIIVNNYNRLLSLTKLLDECISRSENVYMSCDDLSLIYTPVKNWAN